MRSFAPIFRRRRRSSSFLLVLLWAETLEFNAQTLLCCNGLLSHNMFFNVENSPSQESVLNVLNVEPLRPKDPKIDLSWILQHALHNREDGTLFWGRDQPLPGDIRKRDAHLIGEWIVRGHLRNFVDSWLETARDADGSESPRKRDLEWANGAVYKVLTHTKEAQPLFEPVISKKDIGFNVFVRPTKSPVYGLTKPNYPYENPLNEPLEELLESDDDRFKNFFEFHFIQAARLFFGMVASNWKDRLCKCRHPPCGHYYVLQRKPRAAYKRGTFCRGHQQSLGAANSQRDRRERKDSILLNTAAGILHERRRRPEWLDDPRNKERLASEVSIRSSGKTSRIVQKNWITRNRPKIEQLLLEMTVP